MKTEKLLNTQNMEPDEMPQICFSFADASDAQKEKQLITAAEKDFVDQLKQAAVALSKQKALQIILLAGPTCSGKTTTAKILVSLLCRAGHRVRQISIDDFYRDRDALTDGDYESLAAIDFSYLRKCIEQILNGADFSLPVYDFVSGKRSGTIPVASENDDKNGYDIFLFEGIQAFYPEIRTLIPKENRASVFICPAERVSVNGVLFTDKEIRLVRRIVRDAAFRGFDAAHTMRIWHSVRENEDHRIYPFAAEADIHINSFLAYELLVIKPYLQKALSTATSWQGEEAERARLEQKFDALPSVSRKYVPKASMFCEFIGS